MNKIILLLILTISSACSFNSDNNNKNNTTNKQNSKGKINKSLDTDGDLIPDYEELKRGTNPFVADLPPLVVLFKPNFKIFMEVLNLRTQEIENIEIESLNERDNPYYKYSTGSLKIRNMSYLNTGKVGQFESHSKGGIEEKDLNWIEFPQIRKQDQMHNFVLLKKYFNSEEYEIKNIEIDFKCRAKLKQNQKYSSISKLSLNFRFYNYEEEQYQLIDNSVISRVFAKDVVEEFQVKISGLPSSLLEENLLRRGEFIISEITDFQIPDFGVSYKEFINSVSEKTVPLVVNKPNITEIYRVAVPNSGKPLLQLLECVKNNNFKAKENELIQVGEFTSNLKDYTYTLDVINEHKHGKWFVLTNDINRDLFEYNFKKDDYISLTYSTGNKLASQKEKQQNFFQNNISSKNNSTHLIGEITKNSSVSIQVRINNIFGEKLSSNTHRYSMDGGSCGRNCTKPNLSCNSQINTFSKLDYESRHKIDYQELFEALYIKFDQEEFNLKKLIENKHIEYRYFAEQLHLKMRNFDFLTDFKHGDKLTVSIRASSNFNESFNGLKITSINGPNRGLCIPSLIEYAGKNKLPISTESMDFSKWQQHVDWSRLKKGHKKKYSKFFNFNMASIIEHYYN